MGSDGKSRRPRAGSADHDNGSVGARIANRAELSLQELAAQVAAQRGAAQRAAKRRAMRKSGHLAPVAHVYQDLVTVEVLTNKPKTLREYADRCNMPYRTWARHVEVLEGGGWVTHVRGGGRGNPSRFVTHIGNPLPPRPEPKSGKQRYREWYRRNKAARVTESETQPNGEVAHKPNEDWPTNLTNERGTIQPEPNGTFAFGSAGQPPFSPLIGSDPHQEQVLTTPGPAENDTTRAGKNTRATTPPNLTAADPCPGQVQSSGFGLTGSDTDKTLRRQVWGEQVL